MTAAAFPYPFAAKPGKACAPGEFPFAVIGMDHGHIFSQAAGLIEAGGDLVAAWDPDPTKLADFCTRFPQARAARSEAEVLEDPRVRAVTAAAIPDERCALGIRVMEHGKDYLTDKAPMVSLEQVAQARAAVARTRRMYQVIYGERLQNEASIFAEQIIAQGAIGRVLHVVGLGPHRLSAAMRPLWFFDRRRSGGIICDLGSHQVDQFLAYAGAKTATVVASRIANYHHPEHPGLEDFGDAMLTADNGATDYFRVDWFTPDGLGTWGDTRTTILGTDGYIEMRKSIDIARDPRGDQVYLVDRRGEHHVQVGDRVGAPFFGRFIRDCIDRTETAMTQEHALTVAEVCIRTQMQAVRVA
ncbi:MAG: Gfo/Idh/MocA family oxidoreductase [Planctomycetes bacterium]|nr:Gfo/Idh/MocA family oxidoreductase [Planctomycetota bacterium]